MLLQEMEGGEVAFNARQREKLAKELGWGDEFFFQWTTQTFPSIFFLPQSDHFDE